MSLFNFNTSSSSFTASGSMNNTRAIELALLNAFKNLPNNLHIMISIELFCSVLICSEYKPIIIT